MAALGGKQVNVRINSPGGDVFAAHAIFNQLATYSGEVTVYIDGLAASAATIVMMAGKVIMPSNSMIMIHNPAVGLLGYYDYDQMMKMAADLEIVKQSIMNAYKTKSHLDDKKLSKLMDDETWMTAEMAKEYGFVDEVTGASNVVNMVMDDSFLLVNSVRHDLGRLKNVGQLRQLVNKIQPMPAKSKEEKSVEIKTIDDLKKAYPDLVNQLKDEVIKNEKDRLSALDALDDPKNAAVHAIIDDAKASGKTAEEVKPIVDIVKKHAPATDVKDGQDFMIKVITDNKNSGVDGIKADGGGQVDSKQEMAAAINLISGIINKKHGRTDK